MKKKHAKAKINNESLWYSERGTQLKGYFWLKPKLIITAYHRPGGDFLRTTIPLLQNAPIFKVGSLSSDSLGDDVRVTQFYESWTYLHHQNNCVAHNEREDEVFKGLWRNHAPYMELKAILRNVTFQRFRSQCKFYTLTLRKEKITTLLVTSKELSHNVISRWSK